LSKKSESRFIHYIFPEMRKDMKLDDPLLMNTFKLHIESLIDHILSVYPTEEDLLRPNLYTGLSGLAYFFLQLHFHNKTAENLQILTPQPCITLARAFLDRAKKQTHSIANIPSMISGLPGYVALQVVLTFEENNLKKSERSLNQLIELQSLCFNNPKRIICNEQLYGRAGYISALLFVLKHVTFSSQSLSSDLFSKLTETIIADGRQQSQTVQNSLSSDNISPLLFQWHQKFYLGAAHGTSGILFTLMQLPTIQSSTLQTIKETVDHIVCNSRFPSGNYHSKQNQTDEDSEDRLVHWCHGATGVLMMLCKAYERFSEQKYLDAAVDAGKVKILFFYSFGDLPFHRLFGIVGFSEKVLVFVMELLEVGLPSSISIDVHTTLSGYIEPINLQTLD
jgi:lantibiotic modifying enzyme